MMVARTTASQRLRLLGSSMLRLNGQGGLGGSHGPTTPSRLRIRASGAAEVPPRPASPARPACPLSPAKPARPAKPACGEVAIVRSPPSSIECATLAFESCDGQFTVGQVACPPCGICHTSDSSSRSGSAGPSAQGHPDPQDPHPEEHRAAMHLEGRDIPRLLLILRDGRLVYPEVLEGRPPQDEGGLKKTKRASAYECAYSGIPAPRRAWTVSWP